MENENSVDMQVLNLMNTGVLIFDLQGVICKYNSSAALLLGWAPESGSTWHTLNRQNQLMNANGVPFQWNDITGLVQRETEYVLYRTNLPQIHISVTTAPWHNEEGDLAGGICCFQEITPQLQLQSELKKRTKELQDYVDNASIGLHWVDKNGIIKWANQDELDMLGYEASEYIGRHISEFHVHSHKIGEILTRLGNNEIIYQYDSELRCKDGSVKVGRINSSVFMEENEFIHTRCFTIDITEQKKNELALLESEERLKNAAENLEKQVDARTSELASANRKLLDTNAQLEQFSYAASHDMKEPLRKVIFYNNYVWESARGKLTGKELEYLERAMNAAKRMGNLIENLLNFSRLSNAEEQFAPVDLAQMGEEIVFAYKDVLDQQGATLLFTAMPVVNGIAFQLRQLLENLINNALRYEHLDRAAVIDVSARRVRNLEVAQLNPLKEYVEIRVQDNGIGLDEVDAEKIFEIFCRLHGTQTSGNGVGLAICRKIVQIHNGAILATGVPGKGACFIVYLPVG